MTTTMRGGDQGGKMYFWDNFQSLTWVVRGGLLKTTQNVAMSFMNGP